jgi:hypothetical protein
VDEIARCPTFHSPESMPAVGGRLIRPDLPVVSLCGVRSGHDVTFDRLCPARSGSVLLIVRPLH